MGQPPTGLSILFTGIHYYQIQDGRVYTARYEHDLLGLMEQLGMIPPGNRPDIYKTRNYPARVGIRPKPSSSA